jgi:hypothetical protein
MTHPLHAVTHISALVLQTWPTPQVVVPASQRSLASLQLSLPLQATPSLHERAPPPQTPIAEQVSAVVQNRPSLQLAPVLVDHVVEDDAALQIWHWSAGLRVASA